MVVKTLNNFFEFDDIPSDDDKPIPCINHPNLLKQEIKSDKLSTEPKPDGFERIFTVNSDLDTVLLYIANLIEKDEISTMVKVLRAHLCESTETWRCNYSQKGISKYGDIQGSIPLSIKQIPHLLESTVHQLREIAHPRGRVYLFWGWNVNTSNTRVFWHKRIDLDVITG